MQWSEVGRPAGYSGMTLFLSKKSFETISGSGCWILNKTWNFIFGNRSGWSKSASWESTKYCISLHTCSSQKSWKRNLGRMLYRKDVVLPVYDFVILHFGSIELGWFIYRLIVSQNHGSWLQIRQLWTRNWFRYRTTNTSSLTPICESWEKIQKPGTELASFLGEKSNENSKNRVLGTEPAQLFLFPPIFDPTLKTHFF